MTAIYCCQSQTQTTIVYKKSSQYSNTFRTNLTLSPFTPQDPTCHWMKPWCFGKACCHSNSLFGMHTFWNKSVSALWGYWIYVQIWSVYWSRNDRRQQMDKNWKSCPKNCVAINYWAWLGIVHRQLVHNSLTVVILAWTQGQCLWNCWKEHNWLSQICYFWDD